MAAAVARAVAEAAGAIILLVLGATMAAAVSEAAGAIILLVVGSRAQHQL
jgi:hypothetical protein